MIPRVKVNYSASQLARALTVRRGDTGPARHLSRSISERFGRAPILVPSGRYGLYALLRRLPHRRVIVPAYTCKAVVEAIRLANKTPVFVEIEDNGFNMNIDLLKPELTPDAIVVATRQFGIPCAIEETVRLAHAAGAFVIEDAAASLGSTVDGRLTGLFGDAAFFSFDSTKLINVPLKGGFIITADGALESKVRDFCETDLREAPAGVQSNWVAQGGVYLALENHRGYRAFHTLYFERRGVFTADSEVLSLSRTDFYNYRMTPWQCALAARQFDELDRLVETWSVCTKTISTRFFDCKTSCSHQKTSAPSGRAFVSRYVS